MKRNFWIGLLAGCLLGGLLVLAVNVQAQSGGGYDLTWSSVDGGGAMFSTGGGYQLGGAAGQPDAGTLSGGAFTLAGGFWSGTYPYRIYLPSILKNS